MARLRLEPFKIIGSTPAIKKTYGNAVALAPVAPLVAEVGQVDDRYILRISNYETAKTVGQVASPSFHPTLSFAPDGERLLVMTGWRGRGEDLLLYREPWESPRIINQDPPHYAALDGAWLDERTILIAGLLDDHEFCIAVLEVESGASRIVYRKIPEPADDSYPVSFDSASCSPTGSVVFVINYGYGHGQRILLYQLNERYDAVLPITSILLNRDTFYGSYDSGIIIAEDGQTMLSKPSSYSSWHASTRLFNRQGHLLTELYKNQELLAYRYGTACFRRDAGYGTHEIHIYYLREGKLLSRCTLYVRGCYGCNLSERNGKILIAVEEEEKTTVFELTDPDILRLASEDAQQRCGAMQVLGRRHLRDAIPVLAQVLLKDEDASVRLTAVEALVEIGDPAAIPRLIFALGHKACDHLRGELIAALQQFSIAELVPVAFEYIDRVGNAHSRGAARLLEAMPFIEALDKLCKAIGDPDEETRLSAAHALRKRADVRACIALLERMNDEDERVRTAVQHALNRILRVRGLLSREISQHLTIPMDAAVYAEKVIAKGRMRGFERIGPSPIGRFLVSLSAACVQSGQALPQLLNAIEALADGGQSAERTSLSIALVVALICADTMRKEQNWKGAVGTYRVAVELARRIDAPQIEWRAWHAAGECLEKLGDDPTALAAFRHAMDILDRLWFALLEEDKLRGFFRDKALLYDRAALCALRLGHAALALECGEKAKTRYLGDLIARRQMDPRVSLDRELKEIWQNIGHARSIRVQIGSSQPAGKDRVEVVATRWEVRKVGDKAVKLERLSAFEEAHPDDKETSRQHAMIRGVWQLMAYLPNVDDEEIHEYVEEIYQALLPVRQAAKSSELPMPSSEQQIVIERYNNAARALSRAGENIQEAPFWIFSENNFGWIEEICNSTDEEEAGLFLDAVMEALNSYLRDEPIIGVPTEPFDEEAEGPVFVTRTLGGGSASPSRGTTTIETLLESRTHTRWRYITRLARGEIVAYQDVSEALRGQTGVAQVQFAVTAQGTVAYVTHSCEDSRRRSRTMPDLRGDASLCVFTCPEIKLSSLRQRLALADNAWFARYKQRHQAGGLQSWMDAMDETLQWLYAHLIAPIDAHLKRRGVKRLHIIPHRSLQLIPFSAMFSIDQSGQRRYLADDYEIDYAPSATLQHICSERARHRLYRRTLAAVSDPTGDLPFATAEIAQVACYFPPSGVRVWRGDQASAQAVRGTVPESVFHFAGHASYDWGDPLASHLLFARKERLSLEELFAEATALPETNLVVLSACETSVTDPEDLADEYLGLASGFLFAGTPAVVSTLWAVDDISTALLMAQFYDKLFGDGLRPSQAMQVAQRWLRETVDRRHVVDYIQLQLSRLEEQRRQVPAWSEEDDLLARQSGELRRRRRSFEQEAGHREGKPFAHPYYWAAFTLSGADITLSPRPSKTPANRVS